MKSYKDDSLKSKAHLVAGVRQLLVTMIWCLCNKNIFVFVLDIQFCMGVVHWHKY